MSHAFRRSHRPFLPIGIIIAVVSALLVFGIASVASPSDVLGATASKTAKCSANVRTSASTHARVVFLIPPGTKVSVVGMVTGATFRTTCLGSSVSARSWYRISAINGRSVSSLYGVSYVYGATSLFKATPYTRYVACTTYLRTRPSTSSTAKRKIVVNTKVLVATNVTGSAWARSCAGKPVSGRSWYRISMVNGRSVRSVYGVSYLYAPAGSFSTTASTTPATTPTAAPTATPATTPTATPVTVPSGSTVTVSSIPALKTALADDSVGLIVVANGTYHVTPAASEASDALGIGLRFAARTRPVTVQAETRGGVTFDGGGTTHFGCISFYNGSHDQTWEGFNCANGEATSTGVITFGGYAGLPAPHHIVMRNITILASCTGSATSASAPTTDHAFYLSYAVGGPHDLLFEDITVNGTGDLASAFHFYHSDSANRNAWNVTVRRLHVTGTQQPIILWDPTIRNVTFDTADIRNALSIAVRYESPGATGIVFKDISSSGSGLGGFYSSLGAHPAGVTFINDSFH